MKSRSGLILKDAIKEKRESREPQNPLGLDAKKELFSTVSKLINSPISSPNICILDPDKYYTNLFMICCADAIHDVAETRFKNLNKQEASKKSIESKKFLRNVIGKNITEEYKNFWRSIRPDENLENFLKTRIINENYNSSYLNFFEIIVNDEKFILQEEDRAVQFSDIEDFVLKVLVECNGGSTQSINLYTHCKQIYDAKSDGDNKRFCVQNGNEWGTSETYNIIARTIKTNEPGLRNQMIQYPVVYNADRKFVDIDMGVTFTLIDGLGGKVSNLTNVWNNSQPTGSAPGIGVELGNMNIEFQIEGNPGNMLSIVSKYMIAYNDAVGVDFLGLPNKNYRIIENLPDFNIQENTNDINDINDINRYKILYEVTVTRKNTMGLNSTAIYLYELYPTLSSITISDEISAVNRGVYFVTQPALNQEENLGFYVQEYKNKGSSFVSPDCIQIIRKALCDYLQSLQSFVKYGGNSANGLDSILYFSKVNNIIKYSESSVLNNNPGLNFGVTNFSGHQLRTSVHRDRPAAGLASYLISNIRENTGNGKNYYAHTCYTTLGENFFFSNKFGCVTSLLCTKKVLEYIPENAREKVNRKKARKRGGGKRKNDDLVEDNDLIEESEYSLNNIEEKMNTYLDNFSDLPFVNDGVSDFIIPNLISFNLDEGYLKYINETTYNIANYLHGIYDKYYSLDVKNDAEITYIKTKKIFVFTPYNINYHDNLIFFKKNILSDYYKFGYALKDVEYITNAEYADLNESSSYSSGIVEKIDTSSESPGPSDFKGPVVPRRRVFVPRKNDYAQMDLSKLRPTNVFSTAAAPRNVLESSYAPMEVTGAGKSKKTKRNMKRETKRKLKRNTKIKTKRKLKIKTKRKLKRKTKTRKLKRKTKTRKLKRKTKTRKLKRKM